MILGQGKLGEPGRLLGEPGGTSYKVLKVLGEPLPPAEHGPIAFRIVRTPKASLVGEKGEIGEGGT